MFAAELRQIIANGANSGVEFKRDDVRAQQLAVARSFFHWFWHRHSSGFADPLIKGKIRN
jgi:hypothetical protein